MTVTVDQTVEQFTATPRQLFINGQWADAASGKTFETPNPATGVKSSGLGRELGPGAIAAYQNLKTVYA
jgi:acyl-CoA reductase-like NAD-dependent aldehyde dehydrogenase